MRFNEDKTEGLRCGALKHKSADTLFRKVAARLNATPDGVELSLFTPPAGYIQWCERGDYILSLGVPIGWDFSVRNFWAGKYFKAKRLMSNWRDVERMSPHGSAMIANNMVLSRFRYWASCMMQCKEISDALWQDVQALVWSKDVEFDADEIGTQGKVRVFANKHNQCNPRREGGVGEGLGCRTSSSLHCAHYASYLFSRYLQGALSTQMRRELSPFGPPLAFVYRIKLTLINGDLN